MRSLENIQNRFYNGINYLPNTVVIPGDITLPYPKISAKTRISITAIANESPNTPAEPF